MVAGQTIMTHGLIENKVYYKDILTYIQNRYDKNARYNSNLHIIIFDYNNIHNELFVLKYKNDRYGKKEYSFLTKNDYIYLSLFYNDYHTSLIKDIISYFGGWFEECDRKEDNNFIYINKIVE